VNPDHPRAGTGPLASDVLAGVGGRGGRNRAERLAAALGDWIDGRAPAAGTLIGTFESLRRETGFSYATVSEAVRLLRDRGVLEIRPGRGGGLFVADRGPVVRLRHTLLSVTEEAGSVADAIELRDCLEALIDTGAARHRSEADIADLRLLLEAMRTAPAWDAFMRANWALHERIARISPNGMARAVYAATLGHLSASETAVEDGQAPASYRAERYRVHADLVGAIADGDEPAVRAAVARHNYPA